MRKSRKSNPIAPPKIGKSGMAGSKADTSTRWAQGLLPGSVDRNISVDNPINQAPLWIIAISVGVLFIALFLQLFQLQVVEGERMRGIAEGNRVRENVDFAPRGRILDRNGVVLAENTASYQLSVTPYLLPDTMNEREVVYQEIAAILPDTNSSDIAAESEAEGLEHPQPVLVVENISRERALQLEYVLPKLRGFSLDAIPMREYKDDAALSHILGYVGRASQSDLDADSQLHPLDFTGKSGIEAQYDGHLRGENGVKETEVDALGRPLRTLREIPTSPGSDLYLSIDYELQKSLKVAIEKQIDEAGVENGAGIMLHPDTGEVLASVSLPAYDNNIFARGVGSSEYERLLSDAAQPMHNRVSEGGYPTGSIIKPFTLLGALGTNTIDEHTTIYDGGAITLEGGFTFRGWEAEGLGAMDARSAIAMSSNIYFYTVAGGHRNFSGMGIDALNRYYRMFGLGHRTGIDLPGEAAGRVPDPEWKLQTTGEGWYIGDTYNQAIGQGSLLASPLQMARGYAALVNGGKLLRPHLIRDSETEIIEQLEVPGSDYRIVREGLRRVISTRGTTSPMIFEDVGVEVAGKSGTAETDPGRREPHAWYAAYAPYENPEIVSVVLIEEGDASTRFAAPAIAEAFEYYFSNR